MEIKPKTQRCFFAIDLTDEIQQQIFHATQALRKKLHKLPLKWMPPQNYHITLKFLGAVLPDQIPALIQLGNTLAQSTEPFDIEIEPTQFFPNLTHPIVIAHLIKSHALLDQLALRCDKQCEAQGFKPETRPFNGHLTIARVKGKQNYSQVLFPECPPLQMRVNRFVLLESHTLPTGAEYKPLRHFEFR